MQASQPESDALGTTSSSTSTNPWYNLSFSPVDLINIPLGLIMGSMSAIQSNQYSFYCGGNTTAVAQNVNTLSADITSKQTTKAVAQFYQFLQKVDDITINCADSILLA